MSPLGECKKRREKSQQKSCRKNIGDLQRENCRKKKKDPQEEESLKNKTIRSEKGLGRLGLMVRAGGRLSEGNGLG